MNTVISASKLSSEHLDFQVDFCSRLDIGETIATAAASIEVFSGVDPTPSAMLSGSPTFSQSIVTQKIIGGVPGVIYELFVAIRTSRSNIPIQKVKLAVLLSPDITPS